MLNTMCALCTDKITSPASYNLTTEECSCTLHLCHVVHLRQLRLVKLAVDVVATV